MRAQYAAANPSQTSDLYNEGSMFLSAIADGYPIEGSPSIAADLNGEETMEQILEIAVDLEKKAILFYLGMKDVVPENLGRDKLDEIINEEKSHVVLLMKELKKRREAAGA
jgi:rubrerythrin